ncbi:MAG: hypothetical protein M1818_004425 [Claussenomyces sp. TS43310]|nr:MAG: hypothetical protein M1818_004425 [Claussenomyces sp. TS43310]
MPWGIRAAVLILSCLHAIHATASPSINVALKTSFSSAPYLLELLETAADENATSYFPLLDRIADGYFASCTTDEDLYEKFVQVLKDNGHMADPQTLSSFQLALSLHSAAPRIEAHYQYYHTVAESSVDVEMRQDTTGEHVNWVLLGNVQYWTPSLDTPQSPAVSTSQHEELPFDRILGNTSAPASILYADILSPNFGQFHKTLVDTAREGKTSYRVRHRTSLFAASSPLLIGGYGVKLDLKRTDYIVIDDRNKDDKVADDSPVPEVTLEDQELADLKPLSSSELRSLGLKVSSFVMQSSDPLKTLLRLSQDFPKYSSAIAAHNTSDTFLTEHLHNRAQIVPAGQNIVWINGLQLTERQMDAFTLLDHLRAERRRINEVQKIGLTAPAAISLLAHDQIALSKAGDEPQRYDWTDTAEGGNVIIWLNDIEKDKRYEGWPDTLKALLQRTFPGQLPAVRREIFDVIVPIDLANSEDIEIVVMTIQNFVKRKLPIRFGLVPLTSSASALDQAKVTYHLLDTYGISAALGYLETAAKAKKLASASNDVFEGAIAERMLRKDKVSSSLEDVLSSREYRQRMDDCQKWLVRLAVDSSPPPFFVDGVVLSRAENWIQPMSMRINTDLQEIQQAVFEETIDHSAWVPGRFLSEAATRRNALIIPEDEKTIKVVDVNTLYDIHRDVLASLPRLAADLTIDKSLWAHMIVIADLSSIEGEKLLNTAKQYKDANPGIEITILDSSQHIGNALALIEAIGLEAGQHGLLINGRLVGPIPSGHDFLFEDFDSLLSYERSYRISPVYLAMMDLALSDNLDNPLAGAKATSMVAIYTTSKVPEGIYEQAPTLRINSFEYWQSEHTAIKVGDEATAGIRIIAAVDPASEQAQRWIPILKVLSELDGVYLRLFLNPKDRLQELPVKRFYRYVLESKPSFNEDGSLQRQGATFTGVPQEALLTVGLDVPASWLVAPKESVHDLDNVKLSNVKADIDALYELEHILIEGHSRELPSGAAPRGAQLVLGTEREPYFADTIIMANLGYFQFKANPGFYKIELQNGRSSEIFNIESSGQHSWTAVPGDKTNTVALMSFQGTTLYPRLSRKPGQETEDVLESKAESTLDSVKQGLMLAKDIFNFGKAKSTMAKASAKADINIFSVASGHLYERMLNIMMVSVMKNTQHSVKFWFIEQFLSPSFKDFIPYMAAEYGFQYEMVTYKWPHWLRAQTEKQREIWGYKILFLDVLFPLSLDKVIFVDADQIVRTDMIELVRHDLKGAPYGFTPMCDSRTEMEGFRFWKQGYWKNFLKGLPYHISALYVIDLQKFRQIAAGDRLRQQYHQLSADPGSLSNLDQDLPNHMQAVLPIHSLPQQWLWCETWCSDESLKDAKTIDLCNNPLTKEPKLDRARRQVPEWTVYDDEIAAFDRKRKASNGATTEDVEAKNTNSRVFDEVRKSHEVDEL